MGNPAFTPQMTVPEWETLFPNDDACKAYLAAPPLAGWHHQMSALR